MPWALEVPGVLGPFILIEWEVKKIENMVNARFTQGLLVQGPGFPGSKFFMIQVFRCPGFSWSRFLMVQVFHGTGFSRYRFTWLGFSGSSFSGSRFFRVRIQGTGPGYRSSPKKWWKKYRLTSEGNVRKNAQNYKIII